MRKLRRGMALLLAMLLCAGVLPLSGVAHAESLPEEMAPEETIQTEDIKEEEATPLSAEPEEPEVASPEAPASDVVSEEESDTEEIAQAEESVDVTAFDIQSIESVSADDDKEVDEDNSDASNEETSTDDEADDKDSESDEDAIELSDQTLTATVDGIFVTISGKLPENAEIQAVSVPLDLAQEILDALDGGENDEETREVVFALDVSILSHGEKFQPSDFGESVIVTIRNANAEDDPLELLHVKEDVTDGAGSLDVNAMQAAVDAAANGTVETETLATTESGNAVSFNMDSFSLLIASAPRRAPGQANNVETWGELVAAINAIPANGSGEITITADLSSTSNITINSGKTVTIKAAGEAKTINLQGANSFNINGANVTFENLNITKTSGTQSPDIYVLGGSTLTLQDVTIDGGGGGYTWAPIYGGGGTADNRTKIFIYDSTIQNGASTGISMAGYVDLHMEKSTICDNNTIGLRLTGAASATIDNCEIKDNAGVGLYIYCTNPDNKASVTITNSTIERNQAISSSTRDGGGIYAQYARLNITSSEIKDNEAISRGGGIFALNSDISIQGSEISENSAEEFGGGIYAHDSTVFMQDVEIHHNEADYGYGGGIFYQGEANALQLVSGRIYQNKATRSYGGGIYINAGSIGDIQNAVVYENTAENQGGGIWACPTGESRIHVTQGIASFDNTSTGVGDDVALNQPSDRNADPFAYISSRMLGGYANHYYADGGLTDNFYDPNDPFYNWPHYTDYNVQRYSEDSQEWTEYDRSIAVGEGSVVLKNVVSQEAKAHALQAAKLFIYENSAYSGGGIATNGTMNIGEDNTVTLTLTKKWEGGASADKAEFALHQKDAGGNDVTLETVTLTADDNWKYTAKSLPAYYIDGDGAQQDYTYYFKEVSIPGWTEDLEVSEDGKTYTFTNTRDTFDLSGTKTWIDGDKRHNNADEVALTLTRVTDAEDAVSETVDVTPEWTDNTYTYKGLETHDPNGNQYTYTVAETPIEGYETTVDGYDITNRIVGTIPLSASKVWEDEDDKDGIRPEAVTVKILAGGTDTGKTLTLSEANGWADSAELDKYDDDGKEITYTLEEVSVEGYESVISGNVEDGFTVTNSHTPREEPPVEPEKINISVKKVWDDENDKDGIRPDHVTIHLLANGEKAETITLNKDNGWEYTFAGLVKTDGDGKEITYTVTEDAIKEYDSKITGDAASGYVVTNKHTPKPDKPTKPENPKPDAPKNTNVPRTGDDTNLALWFSLMGVALAGLAATAFTTRRRRGGKQSK